MATSFNHANRMPDDVNYALSHRPPPPVPPPPIPSNDDLHNSLDIARRSSPLSSPKKAVFNRVNRSASQSASANASVSRSASDKVTTQRSRGQSFSFLRRSSSTKPAPAPSTDAPPPPVPVLPPSLLVVPPPPSDLPQEDPSAMLRKASAKFRNKASLDAEPTTQPRQPVPSLSPLPAGIASFDDSRPDSVAIFEHSYAISTDTPQQRQQRPAANFSRPQAMAPPAASNNSSSSPGYATRAGAPGSGVSSSPPLNSGHSTGGGEYVVDPYEDRTQSITNRGRFSYASSHVTAVNSSRRIRRRKDPTPFNVLVMGAKNSGKTSFVNFLRQSLSPKSNKSSHDEYPEDQATSGKSSFASHYLETEMDGERVGLTLWDSVGLEKNVVDLQLREMTAFVESKFEDTFVEEQKVMRSPGVKDTHIHCVLLILDPVNLDTTIAKSPVFKQTGSHAGSLDDDLDLQVMRALWGKTTVIPVISKADTLTVGHMSFLKRAVWDSLKTAKLDPLEALELEDDAGSDLDSEGDTDSIPEEMNELPMPKPKMHKRLSSVHSAHDLTEGETPYLPMSILSPDIYDLPPFAPKNRGAKVGRRFAWGFADPHSADHCDFGRLRDSVFLEWRSELRELSRSKWYENWRTSRLKNFPGSRQRVQGGVTPVAAVPRDGRIGSQSVAMTSVPRTVSGLSSGTANGGTSTPRLGGAASARTEVSSLSDVSSVRQL